MAMIDHWSFNPKREAHPLQTSFLLWALPENESVSIPNGKPILFRLCHIFFVINSDIVSIPNGKPILFRLVPFCIVTIVRLVFQSQTGSPSSSDLENPQISTCQRAFQSQTGSPSSSDAPPCSGCSGSRP